VVVFTGSCLFTLLKTSQFWGGQKCGNSTNGLYTVEGTIMYYWMSPPDRGIRSGVCGRWEENHERFESWIFGFFVTCRANAERGIVRHWLHVQAVKNFSKLYRSLSTGCCHRLGKRLSSSASPNILHYATSRRNAVKICSVIANIEVTSTEVGKTGRLS
jgi:hypothetical protein